MDYKQMSEQILRAVGGEKNINSATHCATRLRLFLKDESLANDEEVKKIKGVMGVVHSQGQYQIIIGQEVGNVAKYFMNPNDETGEEKKKFNILELIAGCFTAILPVLTAAGMLQALLGITEPVMYGVNLKLKRPFLAVMIGGACGGIVSGIFAVKSFAFASPGLAGIAIFIGGNGFKNIIGALLSIIVAFVVAFAMTLILGFEDEEDTESTAKEDAEEKITERSGNVNTEEKEIYAPLKGKVISLKEVPDEAFASEAMGKGLAIIPEEGSVVSPVDGVVSALFPTLHAIGLTADNGMEILIHVGLDTVNLNGKYYEAKVKVNDRVQIGTQLLTFDKDTIEKEGYNTVTPVIISNTNEYSDINVIKQENVDYSEKIMIVK